MKRAVFMGSDSFSLPVLSALLEKGAMLSVPVSLVGVVTQPDRPAGRGQKSTPGPVKLLAKSAGVEVLQPERVRDPESVASILQREPDVVVVASYGQILPRSLLDGPPDRAINLHPSLLPRYRGPSPIAAPILNGDSVTGTTLMLMSPRMDAGPVIDQRRVEIEENESAGELAARLASASGELLLLDLPAWLAGEIEPRAQDETEATYTERVTKADGLIDWRLGADEICRRVRAYSPWPGAYTDWSGRRLKLTQVRARAGESRPGLVQTDGAGRLRVGTGKGLIEIARLHVAGGRELPSAEFLRGHPAIAGAELG